MPTFSTDEGVNTGDIVNELDLDQIDELKQMVNYDEKDGSILQNLLDNLDNGKIWELVDNFYDQMLEFNYTKSFFTNPQQLENVKSQEHQYLQSLLSDYHDKEFFEERMKLGKVHERIGLDNTWFAASYHVFFSQFIDLLAEQDGGKVDPEKIKALSKVMFLDLGAVINAYLLTRESIINAQRDEVLELSSPVLKLTDNIIVIPLLGTLDSARAYQIMDRILRSIEETSSEVVILDITGVPVIDTATGANLVRTVKAIRLMGSECILTGLRPGLAQTIVELGIDLQSILTKSTLADGFVSALQFIDQ